MTLATTTTIAKTQTLLAMSLIVSRDGADNDDDDDDDDDDDFDDNDNDDGDDDDKLAEQAFWFVELMPRSLATLAKLIETPANFSLALAASSTAGSSFLSFTASSA